MRRRKKVKSGLAAAARTDHFGRNMGEAAVKAVVDNPQIPVHNPISPT